MGIYITPQYVAAHYVKDARRSLEDSCGNYWHFNVFEPLKATRCETWHLYTLKKISIGLIIENKFLS